MTEAVPDSATASETTSESAAGSAAGEPEAAAKSRRGGRPVSDLQSARQGRDLQTIGSVVERLQSEFPDLSVSKVRYLEEQGLISPQRTRSGYRLFSPDDYDRLHSVLAMQRDEYLPLKVIRRELDKKPGAAPVEAAEPRKAPKRTDFIERAGGGGREFTGEELGRRYGADPDLLAELEEYEIVRPRQVSGVKRYTDLDAGIVSAAVDLAAVGLRPKNLRILKSAVDRESGLIEQVVLPILRSPRIDHQREALDLVENMVAATTRLRQLLIARHVRRLTSGQSSGT
jgi:DNA-binding transcriptional MerR regulator